MDSLLRVRQLRWFQVRETNLLRTSKRRSSLHTYVILLIWAIETRTTRIPILMRRIESISQKIKLATSTSTVLQTFLEYANLYEKNGSSELYFWLGICISLEDWRRVSSTNDTTVTHTHIHTYTETWRNSKRDWILGVTFASSSRYRLQHALSEIYNIDNRYWWVVGWSFIATCHISGIPMTIKSFVKWPLNFVHPPSLLESAK